MTSCTELMQVADAGAFAVVLEAMVEPIAAQITRSISIPTIGIGASPACDGQILVMEDMLGLSPHVPKFVKRFGAIGRAIDEAIRDYAEDVRAHKFPTEQHTYAMKPAEPKAPQLELQAVGRATNTTKTRST